MLIYQIIEGCVRICEGKDGKVTRLIVFLEDDEMADLVRQWNDYHEKHPPKKEKSKKK